MQKILTNNKRNYVNFLLVAALSLNPFSGLLAQTEIEQQNQQNLNLQKDPNNTTLRYSTIKDASGSSDPKSWNPNDFIKDADVNTGMIGNTQVFLGRTPGANDAFGGNPNSMNTSNLQNDDKYKDVESIQAWTQDFQEDVVSGTLAQSNKIFTVDGTVKCYITRDIPIRYKCSYTQLSYGGGMDENGMQARTQCENECYEQFGCAKLVTTPTSTVSSITDLLSINLENKVAEINTNIINDTKVEKLQLFSKGNVSFVAKLDISYTNNKNEEITLVKSLGLEKSNDKEKLELGINDFVKSIKVKLYTDKNDVIMSLSDIQLIHLSNQKYICPKNQDISTKNPGDFAHLCPSGNIKTFYIGAKSYKICADYGIVGDNADGTFSTEDSCNAICKEHHNCKMDIANLNTSVLQQFREGCIAGQTNCQETTCSDLRLNDTRVLNENVFNAGQYPIHTIVNGTQQQGVKRPRPLLSEDVAFQKRNAEEWKDEAYQYMLDNNRYVKTTMLLDEDTHSTQAYNVGLSSGSAYGYSATSSRALFWLLKPRAYDVNTDINQKFYVIVDAVIERFAIDESAQRFKVKDRILYLKTSKTGDVFKPFATKIAFARNIVTEKGEEITREHIENQAAYWEYKSFNGNSWYSHASSSVAEYFDSEKIFLGDRPYLRIEAITNLNNIIYSLPGIVRSITTNGLYQTKNYNGNFDGTGEALGRFAVYGIYGTENLDYANILSKIENKEITPFYDNLSANNYLKTVTGDDGMVKGDISVYQYGPIQKKSAYLRMFPKQEEIGRKGFIYVFGY